MSASLSTLLERGFDACSAVDLPGLGQRPLLVPASEDELCEALRFATRERKTVLPIGLASKLSWLPQLERVDFALSTRELTGVVAYEPGDGTLTALAGTRMSELESAVVRGKHRVTPQVADSSRATLGGVLASGQGGFDRAAFGPTKHHVLGMRVALADGRVVKSGGRLVKNVTGFDMHRLYTGSFGSLCVILEASLRLFPEYDSHFVARRECTEVAEAVQLAKRIASHKLTPLSLSIAVHPNEGVTLVAYVTGRPEPTRWLLEQYKQLLPAAEISEGEECDAHIAAVRDFDSREQHWSELRLTCLPSKLEELLAITRDRLPQAELHVRPAVAELLVRMPSDFDPAELRAFEKVLSQLETSLHWRCAKGGRPRTPSLTVAGRLSSRLRRELDPGSVFAGELPELSAHRTPSPTGH